MTKPAAKRHFRSYIYGGDKQFPAQPVRPSYTQWMSYGELKVKSGSIWIGEPTDFFLESGIVVALQKGNYVVEVKGVTLDKYRCMARLRAYLDAKHAASANPRRGKKLGLVDIDQAMVAICDLAEMLKQFGPKEHGKVRGMIKRDPSMTSGYGHTRLILDNKSRHDVIHAPAGLGDGSYPVFALRHSGSVVGCEIVLIGDEVTDWDAVFSAPRIG